MLRVIFDPNVLISARLSPCGAPGRLFAHWLEGRFELVVSPGLLAELSGVLERSKFRRWLGGEEARLFVDELAVAATTLEDPTRQTQHSRDPDDDYLLALAQAAAVDYLITGDTDLTSLHDPEPAILTPRQFIERLSEQQTPGEN